MTTDLIPTLVIRWRSPVLVVVVVAAIGWSIMSLGCRYAPPHPPTFVDFHRVGPGMLEDEKKLNAQVAVFEAAMFLPRDIEAIRAKGNAHELVGAALQAKVGDERLPVLAHEALLRGSNDPVVLTGVAQSLVREIANSAQSDGNVEELFKVLACLFHRPM